MQRRALSTLIAACLISTRCTAPDGAATADSARALSSWNEIPRTGARRPSATSGHVMTFYGAIAESVMTGADAVTWKWNGGRWLEETDTGQRRLTSDQVLVEDAARARLLL